MNCPKCNSEQNTIKDGIIHGKQRYYCKTCNQRFSENTEKIKLETPKLIEPINTPTLLNKECPPEMGIIKTPEYYIVFDNGKSTPVNLETWNTYKPSICPECKSTNLAFDSGSLMCVCGECGLIIKRRRVLNA